MRTPLPLPIAAGVVALAGATHAAAQAAPPVPPEALRPDTIELHDQRLLPPASLLPRVTFAKAGPVAGLQEARLPVLDDSGRPISLEEIEQRLDGGTGGLLIGGAAGLALGALLGAILASTVQCGTADGFFGSYDVCSPRESALRNTLNATSALTGLVVGMKGGWDADALTWQEAVARIRTERSAAAGLPTEGVRQ